MYICLYLQLLYVLNVKEKNNLGYNVIFVFQILLFTFGSNGTSSLDKFR